MTLDDYWPDCPEPGCQNKVCLALDSDRCFVHTPGNEHVKRIDIDVRRQLQSIDAIDAWLLSYC